MPRTLAKTYNEQMLEIVDKWRASGGEWPAPTVDIAAFALKHCLYEAPKRSVLKQCQRDLARAMRESYHTDPQGRSVRTLHAARILERDDNGVRTQGTSWSDMRTATREHMARAFQLRRKQIVGDCWQLKRDNDSFNENHPESEPIQTLFDFRDDLADLSQPTDYRPRQTKPSSD